MSPGKFTSKHFSRLNTHHQRLRIKQRQSAFKKRRLELKAERNSSDAAKTILEGTSSLSNIIYFVVNTCIYHFQF